MTIYFISRHSGAVAWAKKQGIDVGKKLSHLDPDIIKKGDIVLGILPVNLIAEVCMQGGRYFHLSLDLPATALGKELSPDDMVRYNARLEEYKVHKLTDKIKT